MAHPAVKTLDEDLQSVLNGVETFLQKFKETRAEISKIEIQNRAIITEIELLKSNQLIATQTSAKIDEIQSILTHSTELLEKNKSSKDIQSKLKKLKKKIRELECELSATKESHIKQLFQVETDKDQILQKIRMEVDEEKLRLKGEGLHQEMSDQIVKLEAKLKQQADDFEDRSASYEQKIQEYLKENTRLESKISLIKEENERLRERIRKLEVARLTHCPLPDDPHGAFPTPKTDKKAGTKRKLFNPLIYNE